MSVTEPVDVLLTDREKVPDIRARSLSERRDNIYPVGVKLYCRQVFEVRSTEKACVNPSSPSNPRRVVVQPSTRVVFFLGGGI